MAISMEFIAAMFILMTKPFTLFNLVFIFCLRTTLIVLQTWMDIIMTGISLQVSIFWKVILWTVALISLPLRILTAIQRERQSQMQLQAVQIEVECLLLDMKELEDRLRKAITGRKVMELMLNEVEDEHDKTIARVELLENELKRLKTENLRLKEIRGKDLWNFKSRGDRDTKDIPHVPWKSANSSSGGGCSTDIRELLVAKDAPWNAVDSKNGVDALLNLLTSSNPNLETDVALYQQREVAMKRSLFSALLSFVVGMIVWEARDPCMPLVIALFTVVAMSLKSVVQFFSTIRNKPASDAVALLSLNCFILGTLTYPTLPRVACMLTPLATRVLGQTVRWLGFPSYLANRTAV